MDNNSTQQFCSKCIADSWQVIKKSKSLKMPMDKWRMSNLESTKLAWWTYWTVSCTFTFSSLLARIISLIWSSFWLAPSQSATLKFSSLLCTTLACSWEKKILNRWKMSSICLIRSEIPILQKRNWIRRLIRKVRSKNWNSSFSNWKIFVTIKALSRYRWEVSNICKFGLKEMLACQMNSS